MEAAGASLGVPTLSGHGRENGRGGRENSGCYEKRRCDFVLASAVTPIRSGDTPRDKR